MGTYIVIATVAGVVAATIDTESAGGDAAQVGIAALGPRVASNAHGEDGDNDGLEDLHLDDWLGSGWVCMSLCWVGSR